MLNEPTRGVVPDPSVFSLSGLEGIRAYSQRRFARTPHAYLMGYRVTQVSAGTVVINQPISPWFEAHDGFIDLTATAENSVWLAAMSAAPAGTVARTVNLSIRYLRPCTVDNEAIIARSRVLHAGSSFTTSESLIEDTLGRAVAHATGSVVIKTLDPPPPPLKGPLERAEEPRYTTPDPLDRSPPDTTGGRNEGAMNGIEAWSRGLEDPSLLPPLFQYLGTRVEKVSEGCAEVAMPVTDWFCVLDREASPGLLGWAATAASAPALLTLTDEQDRMIVINQTFSFVGSVVPDGREVIAKATVRGQPGGIFVANAEVVTADGRTVVMAQGTAMFDERRARGGQQRVDRVLLTVLFTDVVGSTDRTRELGDDGWRKILDEHDALIRAQLQLHKGKEVKTTGDGFLATFDSPTRAVRCARGIREGLRRIGLELRAGIHTGECDVQRGDVSGIAVNTASRVQSVAGAGEVLISGTVRDLVAGSDVTLTERPAIQLKGLEGEWTLFAVE